MADFVRIGEQEAEVEVELFNAKDNSGNYVINRKWTTDEKTKTKWTLNGKVTTLKEINALVKQLNIQTDNLCQFLPQDKVHDFSKMNSKQLLGKTIEAIGETQLQEDHERLKNMQSDAATSEENYRMKIVALNDNRKKCDDLEKDVKKEKQQAQQLIELRNQWVFMMAMLNSILIVISTPTGAPSTVIWRTLHCDLNYTQFIL